ncbi:hypothetical protein L914_14080 [Phytophthora nicotianae]|uniref:Uncharacterized protein n=2 Tax=Phytophthora nicotianae TaxID=4792 RepID=W2MTZ8_PHYNI|nr:hypothetical protein L914_14080 [Phytophthora nicotianae]
MQLHLRRIRKSQMLQHPSQTQQESLPIRPLLLLCKRQSPLFTWPQVIPTAPQFLQPHLHHPQYQRNSLQTMTTRRHRLGPRIRSPVIPAVQVALRPPKALHQERQLHQTRQYQLFSRR